MKNHFTPLSLGVPLTAAHAHSRCMQRLYGGFGSGYPLQPPACLGGVRFYPSRSPRPRSIFLVMVLLLSISFFAKAQGIEFQDFNWEQHSATSNERHRLILIDLYASWCGPCKKMEREVFPQPSAGEYFNKRFICTRLDRDSPEGQRIADKYQVNSLPTYLFVDAEGSLVLRGEGATGTAENFIDLGKSAIDIWMSSRWQRDLKNPRTLYHYAIYLLEKKDTAAVSFFHKYLATQKNVETPENIEFVAEFIKQDIPAAFDFFMQHSDAFAKQRGSDYALSLRWACLEREVKTLVPADNPRNLDMSAAEPLFVKYFPDQPRRMFLQYQLRYYQELLYFEKIKTVVVLFASEMQTPEDYCLAAATLCKAADATNQDKNDYDTALQWALQSEKLKPSAQVYNVLFDIYASLGMEKEALDAEAKAKAFPK